MLDERTSTTIDRLRTFAEFRAGGSLAAHEVPHPQGAVLPHADGHFSGGMNSDAVDPALVAFEDTEDEPISGSEQTKRAIFGGG